MFKLDDSYQDKIIETLVRAYFEHPLMAYVFFPEKAKRAYQLECYWKYLLFPSLKQFKTIEAYAVSQDFEGIALWARENGKDNKDQKKKGIWQGIQHEWQHSQEMKKQFKKLKKAIGKSAFQKVLFLDNVLEGLPKVRTPHWSLVTIAVAPEHQGKGLAGRLLRPMLARFDHEKLPCYLNLIDHKNIAFYEHFGFKITARVIVEFTEVTQEVCSMVKE